MRTLTENVPTSAPSVGHTPTPWEVSPIFTATGYGANDGSIAIMADVNGERLRVASIAPVAPIERGKGHKHKDPARNANIAFIVKAVNCHDDLVAALRGTITDAEAALTFMDARAHFDGSPVKAWFHSIRLSAAEALAKADGAEPDKATNREP